MDGLASRRWNPGFVALRWRHLFWALPVMGLLAGVAWFLFQQFKETSTTGTLAYLSRAGSTMDQEATAREGMAFLTSRKVLENASIRLARWKSWGVNPEVDDIRSRQQVEADTARGIPVIRMTVTGRGGKAAHETWMALHDAAWEIAVNEQRDFEQTEIDAAKGKVIRFEAEVAALGNGSLDPLAGNRDIKGAQSRLEIARKELERLEAGQLCGTSFFERVALISSPHLATPAVPFGPAGMLAMHGAVGFGSGLFAAVLGAYLMEFLKPRRLEAPSQIC